MAGGGGLDLSGGLLEALPMPLGSESALGLAGPNGTPDIGELPAPADPAGGVNCANAFAGTIKASATTRTSAGLRDIEVSPESTHATIMWCARSLGSRSFAFRSTAFKSSAFPAVRLATE
jgi:hypothetical protein